MQHAQFAFVAERLSVRLIIVQARRALVGSLSEVVFCMSVRYGFTIEIYEFTHSLRILQHVSPLFYACAHDGRLFGG